MARGYMAWPEAAAGPAGADAQLATRIFRRQPSFCSLFKRGFYRRLCFCLPHSPSTAAPWHMALGADHAAGPQDPAYLPQDLSTRISTMSAAVPRHRHPLHGEDLAPTP